ncbi:MAG: alpha-amylase [Tannerellaceae bacterium]|nr:alpha-amylase [Tannerellaceae bacterium]
MDKKNKMVIYQVLPRLFGNLNVDLVPDGRMEENGVGKFSAFTSLALNKIKELGVTHIWYTGVIEHATQTDYTRYGIRQDHPSVVKGRAGSPYAIKDYYDVDPDLAEDVPRRMKEFEQLVERTHAAGLKVIMDFIPNHVARQYHSDAKPAYVADLGEQDNTLHAFDPQNNFYYIPGQPLYLRSGDSRDSFEYTEFPAKVTGNDHFDAFPGKNDWYETIKLNYGVDYLNGRTPHFDPIPDTWHKMLDILLFWSSKGVDGFRCDMAEMVPVAFWNRVIPEVKKKYPVCFIAEIYNPAEYHNYIFKGHFDYLYDKVGLYDTVRAVMCGYAPATEITRAWQAVEGIQAHMLNFLENHDEQRIASGFFAGDARPGIPGMIVSAMMHANPVMIYSGQEFGERGMDEEGFSGRDGRTTIFDYWSVESLRNWIHEGKFDGGMLSADQQALYKEYAAILRVAASEPVMIRGGFHDLMYANANNPCFDLHRQYAFLRKYRNEVVLVIVNFATEERLVKVHIPAGAFESLGFEDNQPAVVSDLLSGEQSIGTLTMACPYEVTLPANTGKVLKFTYHPE